MEFRIVKIFVAFLTFLTGIGIFLFWNVFLTNQPQIETPNEVINESKPILSVCQLIDSPTEFDGKQISFEATAHVYNQKIILLPKDCSSSNYFSLSLSPKLNLVHFKGKYNNLNTLLEDEKEVDLRITGFAKTGFDEDFSVRIFIYYIVPSDIQLISPIRRFKPRGAA